MNDNTKILMNSCFLYLRLFITTIVTLFSSRFLLQALGASDFGLYSVVGSIVIMMNFLNNVMVNTSFRFIAIEVGKADYSGVNKVFNISLIIHAGLAFLVFVISETLGRYYINNYLNVPVSSISDALFVLRFSVIAAVFSILSIPYQALVTAHENFFLRVSVEILSSILKLIAAVVLLCYLGNRLKLYSLLISGVMLVSLLLFILYCSKKYSSVVSWNFQWDVKKYKEMFGYAGWIVFGTSAHVGKIQGSALIINSFFSTILNAAFGIANQVNSLVLMFSKSLGQAVIPQITKSFSSGNHDRTMQLVMYVSKYSFFLMLLPSVPILLNTEFILNLWLGNVPEYTVVFCRLMIVSALIDCMGAGVQAAVQATGKIKNFLLVLSSISLSSLPVSYVLFAHGYPPYSILVTYIVASILMVVVQLYLLKRLLGFNVNTIVKKSYLKIFYVMVFVSPLFLMNSYYQRDILYFVTNSMLAIVWSLVSVFTVGIEKNEKDLIISMIFKLYMKLKKVYAKGSLL